MLTSGAYMWITQTDAIILMIDLYQGCAHCFSERIFWFWKLFGIIVLTQVMWLCSAQFRYYVVGFWRNLLVFSSCYKTLTNPSLQFYAWIHIYSFICWTSVGKICVLCFFFEYFRIWPLHKQSCSLTFQFDLWIMVCILTFVFLLDLCVVFLLIILVQILLNTFNKKSCRYKTICCFVFKSTSIKKIWSPEKMAT